MLGIQTGMRRALILLVLLFAGGCATEYPQIEGRVGQITPFRLSTGEVKAIRRSSVYRHSMASHRKSHPECAITGLRPSFFKGKQLPIHHIEPVPVRPDLACDTNNMITLCPSLHFWVAHRGNYRTYNTNLLDSIRIMKDGLERSSGIRDSLP